VEAGDLIQERYRLEAPLGVGGMAEVWRAHDERLRRPVAVKLMARHLTDNPDFLVRFFSEAQSVARISHPSVVKVLDFGQEDDLPYLVMELVPGGSLALPEGERLLPERAVELITQAAEGAGAAHAGGLVHRDIKPANILIDEMGDAKLADFGIASTVSGERMTGTGAAIGSPHYISPERVSGGDATPASDVYSLGIVLYELIAGQRPFEGGNATMIAISHIDQAPEAPSVHNPDLDPGIDAIIMRCLAKDPAQRFADGAALAEALKEGTTVAPPVMVPGAIDDEDADGDFGEYEEVEFRPKRRLLIGSVAAITLIVLAVWGFGAGRRGTEPADASVESSSESKETKNGRPKGSPSPSASSAFGTAGFEASPSPSPSTAAQTNGGTDDRPGDPDSNGGQTDPGDNDGGTDPVTDPEPSPSAGEPSPTPPSSEPSPATSPSSSEPSPAQSPSAQPSAGAEEQPPPPG
jgi:serine/threonine-protein kinase